MRIISKIILVIRKPEFIFLAVLLSVLLWVYLNSGSSNEIILVRGLEVWQPDGSVSFQESWFDEDCKVVVYMRHYRHLASWISYIEDYPSVPFILYFAGKNIDAFKTGVNEARFKHPIMIDRAHQFYEMNKWNMAEDYSFISFLVNDNSVAVSNPTLSNFKELLRKCSQSNK